MLGHKARLLALLGLNASPFPQPVKEKHSSPALFLPPPFDINLRISQQILTLIQVCQHHKQQGNQVGNVPVSGGEKITRFKPLLYGQDYSANVGTFLM